MGFFTELFSRPRPREEARYRALAQRLGIADRVHLMGPVANADLPMLYRAADVVVMPSASEGLANAWVEALACGTPIVISKAAHRRRDMATSRRFEPFP